MPPPVPSEINGFSTPGAITAAGVGVVGVVRTVVVVGGDGASLEEE